MRYLDEAMIRDLAKITWLLSGTWDFKPDFPVTNLDSSHSNAMHCIYFDCFYLYFTHIYKYFYATAIAQFSLNAEEWHDWK